MAPLFTTLVKSMDAIVHKQRVTSDKVEDFSISTGGWRSLTLSSQNDNVLIGQNRNVLFETCYNALFLEEGMMAEEDMITWHAKEN